jgi:GDP-mannose transporter
MSANTGGGDYKGVPQEDGAEAINTKRAATSAESGAIPTACTSYKLCANLALTTFKVLPVTSYCAASILMTVVNKYCVSGQQFTMNFLLLTIQSTVCVTCVLFFKKTGLIKFRDFDSTDAKKWFPISFLLVSVIYTGSKSLVSTRNI